MFHELKNDRSTSSTPESPSSKPTYEREREERRMQAMRELEAQVDDDVTQI
ncbi:hypothetical protein [Haloferax sp. ATB1]|uniref:hypothetical protein n=1 Tax=Haloferax sp. ATB1 TaxID=1508454 RepID=UPI000B18489D|nr:hypothetical protein [Haloferax sp. ATB1]